MKKIFISSILAASLLYAENEGAKQEEIIDAPKTEQSVTKPKQQDMSTVLTRSKRDLKKKLKKQGIVGEVYTAKASIDAKPDDPQYYDYLANAYSEALLRLKANVILSKSGSMAAQEALSFYQKTVPANKQDKELLSKAQAKMDELQEEANTEAFYAGLIDTAANLVDAAAKTYLGAENVTGNLANDAKKAAGVDTKTLSAKEKDTVFKKSLSQDVIKQAGDSIAGLIPYENIILTDSKEGEIQIGVLAYTTERSQQLARDLKQGYQSKKTANTAQCKNPDDISDSFDNDELLSKFGIKYFYNEECTPSIMSFGFDSFVKQEGLNTDLAIASETRARNRADILISSFLKSDMTAFSKDSTLQEKIIQNAIEISKNPSDDFQTTKKSTERTTELTKIMAENFKNYTAMSLKGLEDSRIWEVDDGNRRIVGVIRYYSQDSIDSNTKRFSEPPASIKSETTPKNNTKLQGGIKKSSNLEVDDF